MIYDRIEPLTPMRAPIDVSSELSSMKPSATKAKPEYAFKTVMTTARVPELAYDQYYGGTGPLTHIGATNSGSSRETLDETEYCISS